MRNFVAVVLVIVSFLSCTNPNKKIPTIVAFKQGPLDSAYSGIRPTRQSFNVDNNKVNTLKAKAGTEIFIPANCFVDGNGAAITGNVQLEIIEAFSMQDFITSGLATMSDNKMLISNGMLYLNAKSGDTKLQLVNGAALSVSMPTMKQSGGFQMFTGDGTNWKIDSSMTETDYAVPLPLNLLYPTGNNYLWHCLSSYENGDDKWAYYDTTVISFTKPKFENTVIATEEFQRRIWSLASMTERMSYFVNSDYYFDKTDCFGEKFNLDLFKVYYDHPNRSFRESDSIAKKIYIEYFTANEKKMEDFCNKVNEHKRNYYSNWTDTNYHFDFRKVSMKDDYMQVLQYFPPPNSKEIKRINDRGVNLNAVNAAELLKGKGVDSKEINEILTYNFRRQALIKTLQRAKDAYAKQEEISKMYEYTQFSITKMGWINCDRFYEDPTAGKAEIFVKNSSGNQLDFIDCSLVIPQMNARLSAFEHGIDSYGFTKKEGPYTKLPIGKTAIIVGVAMQHDSLFFASKKINIKDGLTVSLPMKYMNTKSLNDSLKLALK